MNIQSISPSSISNSIGINKQEIDKSSEKKFSEVIGEAINNVNDSQINSDNKIEGLIKGEDVNMHDVMLSIQEAQLSMQLLVEVRNKLVDAYQEINRIQL